VDCATDCATWAEGVLGDIGNDTAHCRLYHADAAAENAGLHCPHAGPDGGGVCVDEPAGVEVVVEIQGFAFSPKDLVIAPGTTVKWINLDAAPHTASTTSDATFDSGTLSQGESFSFTFDSVGSFPYQCDIHTSMKGSVTVE
jgi:plastocyanin